MARITSKQAQEMMDAYAKVYETKEEPAIETPVNETPTEDIQENIVRPSERFKRSQQTQKNLSNATKGYKFSGSMTGGLRADPVAKPQPTAQPVARPVPQAQQRPATGGAQSSSQQPAVQQSSQQARPGALSRLGSLAGRAVSAARNVAGNVKQGAQAVAGGIKQGAQAVAGALANKGPIQGRQTGVQRRAQQTSQPVAKPVVTQQPAAKPATQLTGAQRAQQMAKDRIAAGRNTVTGELKSKPKVRKVTSVMDMEGYDPMENLFDNTVQFLVSEGHAKDESEAMSIMNESEFIDAFNQELNE